MTISSICFQFLRSFKATRDEENSEEEPDRVDKLEQEFVKINRNQDHMYKEISGINKTLSELMNKLSTNDQYDQRNQRERDNERERENDLLRRRPEAANCKRCQKKSLPANLRWIMFIQRFPDAT